MTIVFKNVDEIFLPKIEEFSKVIHAEYETKDDTSDKQAYLDETIQDFLLPQNYAVFERLKDK